MSETHPCFSAKAHLKYGRIHLPVAAACNIVCGYCDRRYSCANESRPGVSARLLSPKTACELACKAASAMPNLSVVGIAGPGDPLANPQETFASLRLIRQKLPHLKLCLSTNGLALPAHVEEIASLGVSHMTVTVNAVDPVIGAAIYCSVQGEHGPLSGVEGAALLLARQEKGIRSLKALGIRVKINTVLVPGINDEHAEKVAATVSSWGADLMNCIAMIPVAGTPLGTRATLSRTQLARICAKTGAFLPQMRHCSRCRADAMGLLGASTVITDMLDNMCPPVSSMSAQASCRIAKSV